MGERGSNALEGKRVVVTRAAEQSEGLIKELEKRGSSAIVLPMVAFAPPDDLGALDAAIRNVPRFDWVFLTSQNAVRALVERCESLKLHLREALSGVRVAAVGPATAEAAQKAGWEVSYIASKHEGGALAQELAKEVRCKTVLLPRSDRANPALLEKLKGLGAEVTEVCAYKTVKPEEGGLEKTAAVLKQGIDAVLFFSPSAAHHLQELLGNESFLALSRRCVFAAIGPVTAEALRKAKVERVLVAHDTLVSAVVDTLTDYFAQQGADLSAGVKRA